MIQTICDDELRDTEGGDFGATLGIIAGVIALSYFAYDVYQGWQQYEPTPHVSSTITYY
jgi:uncharacterized membrane protein YebE (DUF533 family)